MNECMNESMYIWVGMCVCTSFCSLSGIFAWSNMHLAAWKDIAAYFTLRQNDAQITCPMGFKKYAAM